MTFLAPGPLSLAEIIEAIRIQSHDRGSNPVFTDDEIKLAIRQAISNSKGIFYLTYSTTIDFISSNFTYPLPADVDRIILVTRTRSLPGQTGQVAEQVITSFRHFKIRGNNTIVFTRDYPQSTMTIWYERDVPIPIEDRTLSGSHSSTTTTLTLTNGDPQLTSLIPPLYFKIDKEIVKVTAVASNTSATIVRAQMGTTAATHDDGASMSQVVMADHDAFYNFLFAEAGRLLNQWRVQTGTGNVDVSANITARRFFLEERQQVRVEERQPLRTVKMKFSRNRRPRREWLG